MKKHTEWIASIALFLPVTVTLIFAYSTFAKRAGKNEQIIKANEAAITHLVDAKVDKTEFKQLDSRMQRIEKLQEEILRRLMSGKE